MSGGVFRQRSVEYVLDFLIAWLRHGSGVFDLVFVVALPDHGPVGVVGVSECRAVERPVHQAIEFLIE